MDAGRVADDRIRGNAAGVARRATDQLGVLRGKVITTFVRRVVVLVRPLDDPRTSFPLAAGMALVEIDIDPGSMASYRALRPDQTPSLIEARFARGDRCFAVAAQTRLVTAAWTSIGRGPLPYLDAEVQLPPDDVCFYDSYTAPAWRARDLSRSRDELCRPLLRASGLRRTVALIARENAAGLRTAQPLGYRAIGEHGLLRLGPLRRRWVTAYGTQPVPHLARAGLRVEPNRRRLVLTSAP